jgi:hypothetical protein
MDTVEQTIEKLLDTVRDLSHIIQVAVERDELKSDLRHEFNRVMEKHNNQD